jgi:diacylglycerol kinase family enzyme
MSRVLIFVNPHSGRGRGVAIVERIVPALSAAGWTTELVTKHPELLTELESPETVEAMIVIGGDGTLRAVIESVAKIIGLAKLPPVLVMGLGTANLMQQHLQLAYDPAVLPNDVVQLLARRKTVLVDTAVANDRLFLLVASCGLDSAIVHQLSAGRTGPITRASYLMPGLSALWEFPFYRLTVEVDGRVLVQDVPSFVFVGNVAEYGAGFPVLDRASSFDQRLDICVMQCQSHYELAQLAMLTMVGQHHHASGVIYTTGCDIRISGPAPAPMQVDGDAAGTTPVHIRLLADRVAFIVR